MEFKKPEFRKTPFTCPHCNTISKQNWYYLTGEVRESIFSMRKNFLKQFPFSKEYRVLSEVSVKPYLFAKCDSCERISLWYLNEKEKKITDEEGKKDIVIEWFDEMIYPIKTIAPKVSAYMPKKLLTLYNEAATIVGLSPKSSSALLRLLIEEMCQDLKANGSNLYEKIQKLVEMKKLPDTIKDSLHIVRKYANNAIHAGEIDLVDSEEEALGLFEFINLITHFTYASEAKISQYKQKIRKSKKKS